MPAVIDLFIRKAGFLEGLDRDQRAAIGDIHVNSKDGSATNVESIQFTQADDLVVWTSLVEALLGRENADINHSNIKLAQAGDGEPFVYVNGNRVAEVKFSRGQLSTNMPEVTSA